MDAVSLAQKARVAARQMAGLNSDLKNRALMAIASALTTQAEAILAANAQDIAKSEGEGLALPLMKRFEI